jgi:phasin family protein
MSEKGAGPAPDFSALFEAMALPGLDPTLLAAGAGELAGRQGEMIRQALDALREGSRLLAGSLTAEEAATRQLEFARKAFALALDGIGALAEADANRTAADEAGRRFREGLDELAAWAAGGA